MSGIGGAICQWTGDTTYSTCRRSFASAASLFYAQMQATMDYSESQQQDMLHLRRLFYGRLGQLSRVRAAIMTRMPAAVNHDAVPPFNLDMKSAADKLTETKEWAEQLCANRAEESRAYLYCAVCLLRGVSLLAFCVACVVTLL